MLFYGYAEGGGHNMEGQKETNEQFKELTAEEQEKISGGEMPKIFYRFVEGAQLFFDYFQ
jgi:hypothetical protein